jgi:hypothetical protein
MRAPLAIGIALAAITVAIPASASAHPAGTSVATAVAPVHYSSCAKLHKKFPHGVGLVGARDHVAKGAKPVTNFTRSKAWYLKNKGLDRDHDGIACEAH